MNDEANTKRRIWTFSIQYKRRIWSHVTVPTTVFRALQYRTVRSPSGTDLILSGSHSGHVVKPCYSRVILLNAQEVGRYRVHLTCNDLEEAWPSKGPKTWLLIPSGRQSSRRSNIPSPRKKRF